MDVAEGEHLALDHDAVIVVVLDDGDLLDALHGETRVVLLQLGQKDETPAAVGESREEVEVVVMVLAESDARRRRSLAGRRRLALACGPLLTC